MTQQQTKARDNTEWLDRFRQLRAYTEWICEPLAVDDYQVQSITETSPPKWHLAHVSWFFETFILNDFCSGYKPFHPEFAYLFNSYYETVGRMHPRGQRGLLSRPTVADIYAYRAYVNEHMERLIDSLDVMNCDDVLFRLELGLNHEQQHQELLFMDIKHNYSVNPLYPAYRNDVIRQKGESPKLEWVEGAGGLHCIGSGTEQFVFDNETPRHQVLLNDYRLADRLITNAEYMMFMEDNGYNDPGLWLADGWYLLQRQGWTSPLYWVRQDQQWYEFALNGLCPLEPSAPVCHVSYYEADAYARWAGKRLPLEAELEVVLAKKPVAGNFADKELLQPTVANQGGQWFGDCWNWTASPYSAYPRFQALAGSMGEYNGKFMSNQMVLKGGCCVTPAGHTRATYRNFFYPHDRWAFTGIRLAEDV
jgi:ergothioneine biosynthesis protein EgtB